MDSKYEINDCVRFSYDGNEEYGYIKDYNPKSKLYEISFDDRYQFIELPEEELTFMPAFKLMQNDIKLVLRHDDFYDEIKDKIVPLTNYSYDEEYGFNLDDIEAMVNNLIRKDPAEEDVENWAKLVFDALDRYGAVYSEGEWYSDSKSYTLGFQNPDNEEDLAATIFDEFRTVRNQSVDIKKSIDLKQIAEDIENFKNKKPIRRYLWSLESKKALCKNAEKGKLGKVSKKEAEEIRELIHSLVKENVPEALRSLAYSSYGGNEIFECDWKTSRDCLLKLMDHDKVEDERKCIYANTLGYIYYYGRCNDGVPEYDQAFKYFNLGLAGGMYESMYKLGDMYLNGYGVTKNVDAAITLYTMVYNETGQAIRNGQFDCKFADAALRMGNMCRDGLSEEDEYFYYTVAEYAIQKRLPYGYYGDKEVQEEIRSELARIREATPLVSKKSITELSVPDRFERLFYENSCTVEVHKCSEGLKITAKRLPKPRFRNAEMMFMCFPEYGVCDLVDTVTITAICSDSDDLREGTFIADDVSWNYGVGSCYFEFLHHGEVVAKYTASKFKFKLPPKLSEK